MNVDLTILAIFSLVLIVFFQVLAYRTGSKKFWEYVDYYWYSIAFFGVFSLLIQYLHQDNNLLILSYKLGLSNEYNILTGLLRTHLRVDCVTAQTSCLVATELLESVESFRRSRSWPIGALEFEGRSYENIVLLFQRIAQKNDLSEARGLLAASTFTMTAIMDMTAEYVTATRAQIPTLPIQVLAVLPYAFAAGGALRLGKVTAKLRSFNMEKE